MKGRPLNLAPEEKRLHKKAIAKAYRQRPENKEKMRIYLREWQRKWRAADPARALAKSRYHEAKHRAKRRARARENHLRRDFGLTPEVIARMTAEQDGVCAICSMPELVRGRSKDRSSLSVDHDHETERVRALICRHCNLGLGHFFDDPSRLANAIEYLAVHSTALRAAA